MINSQNKQLFFELLYILQASKGNLEKLDSHIDYLKNELNMLETADIAALKPEELEPDLKAEWQRYVNYRKG